MNTTLLILSEIEHSRKTGNQVYAKLKDTLQIRQSEFTRILDKLSTEGYLIIFSWSNGGEFEILPKGIEFLDKHKPTPTKRTNEEGSEARPGYSAADPLLNYRNLRYILDAYFKNVGLHHSNAERIGQLTDELINEKEINDIEHRAYHEIEDLVSKPNNNADSLLKDKHDETELLIMDSGKLLNTHNELYMDVAKYQSFYEIRQLIIDFNWKLKVLMSRRTRNEKDSKIDQVILEAIAGGLKPPMQAYYSFITKRRLELEDEKDEEQRKQDYEYYVGKDTILCPTLDKFKQHLSIEKINPDKYKFGQWLLNEQIKYSNARYYYTVWGARGGLVNMSEVYDEILPLIAEEIYLCGKDNQQSIADVTTSINGQSQKGTDLGKSTFSPEAIKRLDYVNGNGYLLSDKIDGFKQIELELLKRSFLDEGGKWIETKNKLCALIHLLHGTYLKTKLPKKETGPSLLCYRRFFETRYVIDISKAFQENQFPPSTVKNYIPDFKFVIPAEDLA